MSKNTHIHSNVIKGRVQSKSDTTARWESTQNFIPLKGEIIIYTDYYENNRPAIKVGDGKTRVQDLDFLGFEAHYPGIDEIKEKIAEIIDTYATKEYVQEYGGKIDSISIGGVEQTIDENKNVNIDDLVLDCGTSILNI